MSKTSLGKYKRPSENWKLYKKSKKRIHKRSNFIVVFASKFRCINPNAIWGMARWYLEWWGKILGKSWGKIFLVGVVRFVSLLILLFLLLLLFSCSFLCCLRCCWYHCCPIWCFWISSWGSWRTIWCCWIFCFGCSFWCFWNPSWCCWPSCCW